MRFHAQPTLLLFTKVNLPILHHKNEPIHGRQKILFEVAPHGDDVGKCTGDETTDALLFVHALRSQIGSRLQNVEGLHARLKIGAKHVDGRFTGAHANVGVVVRPCHDGDAFGNGPFQAAFHIVHVVVDPIALVFGIAGQPG